MSKRLYFSAWIYVVMAFLPCFDAAADEFLGEYGFKEYYISNDDVGVYNGCAVKLWRKDDNEHFLIQFSSDYDTAKYHLVQLFDDTLMYFEKDEKIYTFTSLFGCNGQIKAAGRIWGAKGLWQIQQHP